MLALLVCALQADFKTWSKAEGDASRDKRYKEHSAGARRTRFFQVRNKKARNFLRVGIESRITANDFRVVQAPDIEEAGAPLEVAESDLRWCEMECDDNSPRADEGRLVGEGGSWLRGC